MVALTYTSNQMAPESHPCVGISASCIAVARGL